MHAHSFSELKPHPYGDDFKTVACDGKTCMSPLTCRLKHMSLCESHLTQVYDEDITIDLGATEKEEEETQGEPKRQLALLITRFPAPHNYVRIILREAKKIAPMSVVRLAHPLQRIVLENLVENPGSSRPVSGWWTKSSLCTSAQEYINGNPFRWVLMGGSCTRCKSPFYADVSYSQWGVVMSCFTNGCQSIIYPVVPQPAQIQQQQQHVYQQQQQQQVYQQQQQQSMVFSVHSQQVQQQQQPISMNSETQPIQEKVPVLGNEIPPNEQPLMLGGGVRDEHRSRRQKKIKVRVRSLYPHPFATT